MSKRNLSCSFFFMFLLLTSCLRSNEKAASAAQSFKETDQFDGLNLSWNKFQFTSKEVDKFSDMIEQTLVDYIAQFNNYSIGDVDKSLGDLIIKSERDSSFFIFLKEKFFDYLNHPNSPMRNDLYFEYVLKNYQKSSFLSASEKERDAVILDLIKKNQIGTKAADFQFENKNSVKYKLSDFRSSHVLLVFYDPNCPHCNEIIASMKSNTRLNDAIETRDIVVLAIDPLGEIEEWKRYSENIPRNWVNGIDRYGEVLKNGIYSLQAYPTIYLISPEGVVLLKDVYFSDIENYLFNLS